MITKNNQKIIEYLDEIILNPKCELNYINDYELLIAVMLSAQSTDKMVNRVTEILYKEYPTIRLLMEAKVSDIENIIRPVGTYKKKAMYIKVIAKVLNDNYKGKVPRDRDDLQKLPGIGRKSANVILSELYNVPTMAVDTHVIRISKRLGLVNILDDVVEIERKLMNAFPKENWNRINHQLLLFGRYYCKARNPKCNECVLKNICKKENI